MFSTILAIGIVLMQIGIVTLIIGWLLKAPFVSFITRHSSIILLVTFLGSAIFSMIYQYVLGYPPCVLCWYQRIFIFGIAILMSTGNMAKNKLLNKQIVIFSSIGLAIALFHSYINMFPVSFSVCGVSGPSCIERYVYEFGYITIPVMSATVLLLGLILALLAKRYPQDGVVEIRNN